MTNLASESTQQPTGFSARLAGLGTALWRFFGPTMAGETLPPFPRRLRIPNATFQKPFYRTCHRHRSLHFGKPRLPSGHADVRYCLTRQPPSGGHRGLSQVVRRPGVTLASLAILCSVLGSLSGNLLAGPRLPFAMARSGQAPQFLAMLHPVYKTPIWSIVALVVWSVGLLWIGLYLTTLGEISLWGWVKIPMKASADLFDWLTNFAMFGSILFETMGVVSVLMLRRLAGSWDGYRCPGVPLIPLVYLILPLFLFFNMLQKQPSEAVMGILFSLFE